MPLLTDLTITRPDPAAAADGGAVASATPAVSGAPRRWLRVEGLAAFVAGVAAYIALGGDPLWLVPAVLLVDISMVGYLAGPRVGSVLYDLAHTWAAGLAVVGLGWLLTAPALLLMGTVLIAHVGMDRLAGYGLKYSTSFADTHLGRIGR